MRSYHPSSLPRVQPQRADDFLFPRIMGDESPPATGSEAATPSGPDLRAMIKDSLLEVLRENPSLLQPPPNDQPQQRAPGESGKLNSTVRLAQSTSTRFRSQLVLCVYIEQAHRSPFAVLASR